MKPKTLKAKDDIEGGEWTLPKGCFLEGKETGKGIWRVWRKGNHDSFISGVPARLLYVFPAK